MRGSAWLARKRQGGQGPAGRLCKDCSTGFIGLHLPVDDVLRGIVKPLGQGRMVSVWRNGGELDGSRVHSM